MKKKMRKISLLTIIVVLAGLLLLGGCNRPKTTEPVVMPTLAIPIATLDITDTAEEEAEVDNGIEIIEEVEEPEGEATEEEAEVPVEEVTPEPEPTEVTIPEITRPESYTLQADEFPYCIARRFDVNITSLLALNGLSTNSVLSPGAVLKIPQDSVWNTEAHGARALRAHPATYTVSWNDNIYKVACYYGDVSPEQIIAANDLVAPYTISQGQVLQIP
ncbi:MAG TPA: LysM domain-containing protein [Chloroflexi bacterium]|nr:LysM domain-containing protein [Chloroflexota bacterium]